MGNCKVRRRPSLQRFLPNREPAIRARRNDFANVSSETPATMAQLCVRGAKNDRRQARAPHFPLPIHLFLRGWPLAGRELVATAAADEGRTTDRLRSDR